MQITTIKNVITTNTHAKKKRVLYLLTIIISTISKGASSPPLPAPKMYYKPMIGLEWLVHEGQTSFSLLLLCSNGE